MRTRLGPKEVVLELNRLRRQRDELLAALKDLVRVNETWNDEVQNVIGRPPTWTDGYLDAARAAIERAESE